MISRRKTFFFYIPLCLLLVLCFCIVIDFKPYWRIQVANSPIVFGDLDDERNYFVVVTSGCRIPAIDPFDDVIKPLIQNVSIEDVRQKCGRLPPLAHLVSAEGNNRVVVDVDALGLHKIDDIKLLNCSSTAILNDVKGIKIDDYYYAKSNRYFNGLELDVVEDHVRVQCHYAGQLIYTDFYSTIQVKPELEANCDKRFDEVHSDADGTDFLSVLILTLDSVSRVTLHRHLRHSVDFLTETMGGIEFMGYNKLGDNTYPIVMSFLTGLSATVSCWSSGLKMNGCPFIWKDFSKRGYRTAFGEDAHIISSYHTAGKPGFGRQPTDYYLRPLMKAEYESVNRTPWNPDDYICFAKRIQAPVLVNYARDFAARMKNKPYFGYFHSNGLTHDEMNWAQLLDPMLYEFLNESHHEGYLNHTVFMLMSDHGARFGPVRQTYIGKLEESLPCLILVFPPWFKEKHPETMRTLSINTRRLMSSFDIHETLLDIMNGNYDRKVNWRPSKAPERMSLFDEIPDSRTCMDADIPENYCACQTVEPVSNTSKEALLASSAVVSKVNQLTESYRNMCRELSLHFISRIYASKPTSAFSKDKNKLTATVYDYTVTVFVQPGMGQFEATVRFQGHYLTGVLGDISRINRYGNTSACVTDAILKKYCSCRQTLI